MKESGVLAIYRYLDDLVDVIETIKKRPDFEGYEVFSPTSYHEIEHASSFSESPVRFFTLVGGCVGTVAGFGLALACDYDWPIVVGGKMAGIYSLPAYVILGFEVTILLGAIMTIGAMLIFCRIPNPKATIFDKRFTNDHFGVFVPGVDIDSEQSKILKEKGAIELKEVSE